MSKILKNNKIAITCNVYGNCGGMETFAFNLISQFREKGIEPIVIAKEVNPLQILNRTHHIETIKCKFIPRFLEDLYFSFKVKLLRKKFNIKTIIACCRCIGSEIVVCGGTHPGYLETKKKKSLYDIFCTKIEDKQYKHSHYIVAHSYLIKKELIKYYPFIKNKIRVFYPLFKYKTEHFFSNSISDLRKKYQIQENKILFLFISSSHKRKGYYLLKKIFENTKLPITLAVCGKPLPEKNNKNIIYLGFQQDLKPFYQMSDYTVLASSYEPFGLAPIESLSCGTPVLISKNLGCSEIIKSNAKIEFVPNDLSSLSKAIDEAVKRFPNMKHTTNIQENNLNINIDDYNQANFYINLIQTLKD